MTFSISLLEFSKMSYYCECVYAFDSLLAFRALLTSSNKSIQATVHHDKTLRNYFGISSLWSHTALIMACCIHSSFYRTLNVGAIAHVSFSLIGVMMFSYFFPSFKSIPGTGNIAVAHTPRFAASNLVANQQLQIFLKFNNKLSGPRWGVRCEHDFWSRLRHHAQLYKVYVCHWADWS